MKTKIFSLTIVAAVLMLSSSCNKKETPISDYPSLTITSPAASGAMYYSGNAIHITGTANASATDDAHLLHELSLTVKNTSNNAVVWKAVIRVHDLQSYTIDTSFIAPVVTADVDMVLYDSLVNHLEKYAVKSQTFMVMP